MENEQGTKFVSYTWWICGIIGMIIGMIVWGDDNLLGGIFIGVGNGAIGGYLLGLIIDKVVDVGTNVSDKIEAKKELKADVEAVKDNMNEYKNAQHSFQFISNDTLKLKLEVFKIKDISNMSRLALEEEMVKRGLLAFSPMHEKLEKMKDLFSRDKPFG